MRRHHHRPVWAVLRRPAALAAIVAGVGLVVTSRDGLTCCAGYLLAVAGATIAARFGGAR